MEDVFSSLVLVTMITNTFRGMTLLREDTDSNKKFTEYNPSPLFPTIKKKKFFAFKYTFFL